MAYCKAIGENFDSEAAYASSFGPLNHKTVYYGAHGLKGLGNLDRRDEFNGYVKTGIERGLKARSTTAGGAGTAGYAMIPVYVDPRIIDTTRKYTPLVELFPRVTNRGMYADWNTITAKGGGFTAAEDASMSETTSTEDRNNTAIKFLYSVGRVTGPSQAAQPSYIMAGMMPAGGATGPFQDQTAGNAKQMEVLVKTREIKELEENLLINGNATTSGITGNPNGTEFDGIVTLMSTTNTVDKSTTAINLKDYGTAARYAFDDGGRPNLGIASSSVVEDTLALLGERIGYMNAQTSVFWGFTAITVKTMTGDIPIIPSMFLSNTSGSKAAYLLDMSVVELRVLQDLTYEDLAHTNDSNKFMLKIYECLVIKNTAFCASITSIK